MKNFNHIELRILKNLRESLEETFVKALELFPVNSEQYLAVMQRLTISADERSAARAGRYASATVEVTDFIEMRRTEAVQKLISEYTASVDDDESHLWVKVSMLAAEGLVELDGPLGVVSVTKAGLEAIREGQIRG